MNKLLKSLAVAGLATGALLSTAGLASAQQTASLTTVIEKIELLTNGDAVPVTVYQPAAGIAATSVTTVDLFNASQKLGVRLPIAAPQAGTYNTMLVTFGTLSVGNGTASRNLIADLQAARQLGTDAQGRGVLILGDCGTAVTGVCGDLRPLGLGADIQSAGSIQPIVSTGLNTAIDLPALNFFLPRSQVEISGTAVTLNTTPLPVPVVSQVIDRSNRPNVTVGIRQSAFNQMTGGSATHVVRVGLWPCAVSSTFGGAIECASGVLNPRPLVSTLATIVSNSAVTVNSPTNVTFIDVPDGAYVPMAWRDSNNNQLLDEGEFTLVHATNMVAPASFLNVISTTTNATYTVTGTGATNISSTAENGGFGAGTVGGLGTTAADGFLGEAAGFAFGSRSISLTIAGGSTVSQTGAALLNNGQANIFGVAGTVSNSVLGGPISPTNATGAVTIAVQLPSSARTSLDTIGTSVQPSRTIQVGVIWAADAGTLSGSTANDLGAGEVAHAVVQPQTVTASNTSVVFDSLNANDGRVRIANVPYVALTSLGATHVGEYIAQITGRIGANGSSGAVRLSHSGAISSTTIRAVTAGTASIVSGSGVTLPALRN